MTQEERTAVHIASKAACRMHQVWPKEVVEKYLAAEIITRPALSKKTSLSSSVRPLELMAQLMSQLLPTLNRLSTAPRL